MDDLDYSSSPDPIILPSSPPSGHVRNRLEGYEVGRTKSPAKSFIINTPDNRGKSPWRIRLTAEPQSESGSQSPNAQSGQRTKQHAHYQKSPTRESRRNTSVLPDPGDEPPSARATRKRKRDLRRDQDDYLARIVAPSASKSLQTTQSPRNGDHATAKVRKQLLDSEVTGDQTLANEDFTMISGASLASIKANNSVLGNSHRTLRTEPAATAKSELVAYKDPITYPDLQNFDEQYDQNNVFQDRDAETPSTNEAVSQAGDYDVMSWQPTHQAQIAQQLQTEHESQAPVQVSHNDNGFFDEDIWAEEASRSLEQDAPPLSRHKETADFVPPIFSDEAQAPRRSKIPKTWRNASGVDISYSDSPAQKSAAKVEAMDQNRSASAYALSSSPQPQQNNSHNHAAVQREQNNDEDYDGSELTNPDAAATQLQTQEKDVPVSKSSVHTPRQPAHGVNSPSADETGLFWHTDRKTLFSKGPLRPRYQREDLPDLSKILNAQTPGSSRKKDNAAARSISDYRSTLSSQPLQSVQPLPKSKLREAVPQDVETSTRGQLQTTRQRDRVGSSRPSHREQVHSVGHDGPLQDNNKRQAHRDNNVRTETKTYGRKYFGKQQTQRAAEEVEEEEDEYEDKDERDNNVNEVSQSYEEYLNRMSPGKVKVNFHDSISGIAANDRLKPTRAYPSLFSANDHQHSDGSSQSDEVPDHVLDKARKTSVPLSPETKPGIMSRWSSAFWSTFIRARGPIYHDPGADNIDHNVDDLPAFPPTLRARIRARYGVLQDQHPWTMMHMRTLHRMVKSVLTRRSESIIPTTLRLPWFLDNLVDTVQNTATGKSFDFTFEHACAVWSFMQILVPLSLVRAMERGEVEWLGDDITKSYRGRIAGRWGAELCFRTVNTPEGLIDWQWLVACLGCVLSAEEMVEEQEVDDSVDND